MAAPQRTVTWTAADGLAESAPGGAVYYGVVRRIPDEEYDRRRAAILEWDLSDNEVDALCSLQQLTNALIEPVPGSPIERVVTRDHVTREYLVLYRVAFRKVEPQ